MIPEDMRIPRPGLPVPLFLGGLRAHRQSRRRQATSPADPSLFVTGPAEWGGRPANIHLF